MNENIKNFWENAHNMRTELWLSGYSLEKVWNGLNIINKLVPNIKVLNIGVGLGNETIELSQHKDTIIDVLDISEKAIDSVKNITRAQYLSSNIFNLPINEYDIVVSHLVTQHMNDEDLNEQIKYVLRSLKPDGIFAMQFAFVDGVNMAPQGEDKQTAGSVIRSLSEIEKIVKNNNGYLSWISDVITFKHTASKWQYVHIKRNDNG